MHFFFIVIKKKEKKEKKQGWILSKAIGVCTEKVKINQVETTAVKRYEVMYGSVV